MVKRIAALALASAVVGCSPFLEASRPDPVDLSQFSVGQNHIDVVKVLGPPLTTAKDHENSCDLYQLYTRGPGPGGKAAFAAGEAIADVFTIGLAEVVFTPTEIVTKDAKHSVMMCYGPDDKLVSVEASDTAVGEAEAKPASATVAAPGSGP